MDNLDLLVLRTLRDWRRAGRRAVLFTVVRTWGSSPRPIGALMALAADGAVVGSVSGGCIEDDLIQRYAASPAGWRQPGQAACSTLRYGVSADEAQRFGLPCGGTMELVAEFDPDLESLDALVEALRAGRLVRRSVRLADGAVALAVASPDTGAHSSAPQSLAMDATTLSHTFGPGYRLLLIGAGQLAEYLATMALFNGYAVTVCDPRREHALGWSVPGVQLVADMPDDAVAAFRPDRRSAVIALTHDPKLDDLALIDALATDAMYVGAIGSRRNSLARRQRLAEHFDIRPEQLARLKGPIGVFIGSKTPAEIAVSVMAELLAVKNGVALATAQEVGSAKDRDDDAADAARAASD